MEISSIHKRKRREFGQHFPLRHTEAKIVYEITADPKLLSQHVVKGKVDKACQAAPLQHNAEANTKRKEFSSKGMLFTEGGWPKEINHFDDEQKERYQKRSQRDDEYLDKMPILIASLEKAVLQNNVHNDHKLYWENAPKLKLTTKCTLVKLNVYRAQEILPEVTHISLQPGRSCQIAVTMATGVSYIWDENYPIQPALMLSAPVPMTCIEYPKENRLGGGLDTGVIAVWDSKIGGEPATLSAPMRSHHGTVTCFRWISSKTGQEFCTAAEDGWVKWWDCESMQKPLDEIRIGSPILTLEYDPNMPTKYLVGTADGYVVCGNRRGTTDQEKLPWRIKVGCPVTTLAKNPAFAKIFLTVEWNKVKIWSEECRSSAIFSTKPNNVAITTACWSPVRSSLIVAGREDGYIEVWEFLERGDMPIVQLRIDLQAVTALKFHEECDQAGKHIVVGAKSGSIYIAELIKDLAVMNQSEKAKTSERFDLEVRRVKLLEARIKEMAMKNLKRQEHEISEEDAQNTEKQLEDYAYDKRKMETDDFLSSVNFDWL